jgi:hypothetical protein
MGPDQPLIELNVSAEENRLRACAAVTLSSQGP